MVITMPQTVCYRDAIAGMTHKVAPLHHDHEVSGHFNSNITPSQTTARYFGFVASTSLFYANEGSGFVKS